MYAIGKLHTNNSADVAEYPFVVRAAINENAKIFLVKNPKDVHDDIGNGVLIVFSNNSEKDDSDRLPCIVIPMSQINFIAYKDEIFPSIF